MRLENLTAAEPHTNGVQPVTLDQPVQAQSETPIPIEQKYKPPDLPPYYVQGEIRALQFLERIDTLPNSLWALKSYTPKPEPDKKPEVELTPPVPPPDKPKEVKADKQADPKLELIEDPDEKLAFQRIMYLRTLMSTGIRKELTRPTETSKIKFPDKYISTLIKLAEDESPRISGSHVVSGLGLNRCIRDAVIQTPDDIAWICNMRGTGKNHNFAKALLQDPEIKKLVEGDEEVKDPTDVRASGRKEVAVEVDETRTATDGIPESDEQNEKIIDKCVQIAHDLIKYLTTGGDLPPLLAQIIEHDSISNIEFRKEDVPKVVEAANNKRGRLEYGLKIVFPLAKNRCIINEIINGENSKAHIKWICDHSNSAFAYALASNREIKTLIKSSRTPATSESKPTCTNT